MKNEQKPKWKNKKLKEDSLDPNIYNEQDDKLNKYNPS